MYEVILNVIKSKRYELADMLTKIDTLWVQGSITEEQRLSLISDAQNNAMVENSIDILNKLYELDRRVTALENKEVDKPVEDETEEITYPPYEAGKWYYKGDKVICADLPYECIAPDEVVCTWSPLEYPAYWQLIIE
jgi:hypothetical protein